VALGSSTELKVGQSAFAIGNPFGLDQSLTSGIISALKRRLPTSGGREIADVIQTDAAINPGNSGGPLLDSAGQVIGVNTAVSQDAQGIGFAIPIDVAKPIMEQAVNGQQLTRPWIGIFYQPVTKQLAKERNLSVSEGVIVDSGGNQPAVFPNSPAADAGLQQGDVITAVDGTAVNAETDLAELRRRHTPGDTITLHVLRGGTRRDVAVTLGTRPANRSAGAPRFRRSRASTVSKAPGNGAFGFLTRTSTSVMRSSPSTASTMAPASASISRKDCPSTTCWTVTKTAE
jgi:2-alkenal reductase